MPKVGKPWGIYSPERQGCPQNSQDLHHCNKYNYNCNYNLNYNKNHHQIKMPTDIRSTFGLNPEWSPSASSVDEWQYDAGNGIFYYKPPQVKGSNRRTKRPREDTSAVHTGTHPLYNPNKKIKVEPGLEEEEEEQEEQEEEEEQEEQEEEGGAGAGAGGRGGGGGGGGGDGCAGLTW